MRFIKAAIVTTCLVPAAAGAADYDLGPLRGTQYGEPSHASPHSWEGFYAGGFGGYSQTNFQFAGAARDLAAGVLANTVVEEEFGVSRWINPRGKNARDASYGGFIGYNWQYDEAVLGFEADFTFGKMKGIGSHFISRSVETSNGYFNDVNVGGTGVAELSAFGTIRARAGYTSGMFMPFVTGGVALGQIETASTASAQIAGYDLTARNAFYAQYLAALSSGQPAVMGIPASYGYTFFDPITLNRTLAAPVVANESKTSVAFGLTGGVGMDVAITQNVFLRGEYQFIYFDNFNGNKFAVNTVRAAAGVKF